MAVTDADIAEQIREGGAIDVQGLGSKRDLGQPHHPLPVLSLQDLRNVHLYEPEELIIEVGAGHNLDALEAVLQSHNQHLAFEPPDFGPLLGTRRRGSVGGTIACNLSGPRRFKAGAARDHLLGFTAINGQGEIYKAGGRVVKNVTGFDLAKLMTGSYGTLSVLTRVTLKCLPRPQASHTVLLEGCDIEHAVAVMAQALNSSCEVSGACFSSGRTALRLEGSVVSVRERKGHLVKLLEGRGFVSDIPDGASQKFWAAIRDATQFVGDERPLWRITLPPSTLPAFIQALEQQMDFSYLADWGGGLLWLATSQGDAGHLIRSHLSEGQAMLLKAPLEIRRTTPVFHPLPQALQDLHRRIKHKFDPSNKLNPGRMGFL